MSEVADVVGKQVIIDGKVVAANEIGRCFYMDDQPVYEVIRLIDGVPMFFEEHMERMRSSCQLVGMPELPDDKHIKDWISVLCMSNSIYYYNIKLIASMSDDAGFSLLIYFLKTAYPEQSMYIDGIVTRTVERERNNPNAKILDLTFKDDMNKIMAETKSYELLLVNRDGLITEGSRSNVFFIKGSTVYTAPTKYVLAGITRRHIMEACRLAGADLQERALTADEIGQMEAAFMSGTSPRVLPIAKIDEISYNSSSNKLLKAIADAYDAMIKEYIEARGGRTSFEADCN